MKNLTILLLAIASLLLASCEDSLGPVINTEVDAPTIMSPSSGNSFVLTEEEAEETLLTLEWTAPDYGFTAPITYIVQMAEAGTEFEDPSSLGESNTTSYSITVGEMNSKLLSAGFPANQEADIEVRVVAQVNENIEDEVSEPITLELTPYLVVIEYPSIYVPGGYQSSSGYTNDWSPADAPALTSVNDNNRYEGYVYFSGANEFKFTAEQNWDNGDWGGSNGELAPGGANLSISEGGYYRMNVDLNNLTYSILNTDWGLIGDATPSGWDADTDMTYDQDAKVWSLTVDLGTGYIKFRANDAWDLNYGDDGVDGILEQGGADIEITEAGNYTITLDLAQPPYTYTLTQN